MKRHSLTLAFATTAAAALLTGCDLRNNHIGPTAERDELKGSIRNEQVFTGGPEQTHTTISAAVLKPGKSYQANGALTIEGDIPEKTRLYVNHGELTVRGSIGKEAFVQVAVPLVTHTESYRGPGYCYKMNGSYGYSSFCRHTKTIVDGLRYDDPDPAIRVTGRVDDTAKLTTAGAVEIRGQNIKAPSYPVYKHQ